MFRLAWFTDSDPFVRFALWAGVLICASIALCAITILVLRFLFLSHRRHLNRCLPRWRVALAAGMLGEMPTINVARRDRWDFIKLWCQLHDSVRGEAREALQSLARSLGMPKWARALGARRRLRNRILGLSAMGRMGDFTGIEQLESLLNHPDNIISLTAAQAYARLVPTQALPPVLEAAAYRYDWPAARLMEILRDAGAEAATRPLLDAVSKTKGHARKRLIPLLVCLQPSDSAPTIHDLLAHTDDAESLAAALPQASPEDLPLVRHAATHTAWYVRSKACQALSEIGSRKDFDLLTGLLGDPQWWVRYRAAEALIHLPDVAPETLRQLAADHADPYAREMLRMWLDSRGRNP